MLGEGQGACWERDGEHAGRGTGSMLGEGRGACWEKAREHAGRRPGMQSMGSGAQASIVVACRLSNCGLWALELGPCSWGMMCAYLCARDEMDVSLG